MKRTVTLGIYQARDGGICATTSDMMAVYPGNYVLHDTIEVEVDVPAFDWVEHDENCRANKIRALKAKLAELEGKL